MVGPLLGLALYEALNHRLRPLFFFAVIPALLSVGLIALVRESPRPAPAPVTLPGAPSAAGPLPGRYWRVVGFLGSSASVNFSDAFIILRASDLGLGFASIILAYALYNALYAGLSYPRASCRTACPATWSFAAGLGVFAVAYLGLGLARSSGWVWVLLPLYGAYTALTDGVGRAWVANLVPADRLGRGLGLYQAIIGATALLAGVWAGLAWSGDGRGPLIVSGAVAAALALVMVGAGQWLEGERVKGIGSRGRPDHPRRRRISCAAVFARD